MLVFSFPFQTEEQEQPLNRKRVLCYQLADDPLVIIKVKVMTFAITEHQQSFLSWHQRTTSSLPNAYYKLL